MSEVGTEGARPRSAWRSIALGVIALFGVVVLALLVAIQARTDKERDDALRWQSHSYEVMIRTTALAGSLARAEAALGRYVVSADKNLGRQYSDEWTRAGDQIDRLAQMTSDNPPQFAQITALRRAYRARGKELSDTALYSVYKRNRDALGEFYRISDTPALERLNADLKRVIDNERAVLAERTRDAADSIARSTTATRVLAAFGVLIVLGAILLGWLTVQAQGERAAADAEAQTERSRAAELQDAVEAATRELRQEARVREQTEAQLRQVQKMEAIGQLTGGIAHDFNNMLAVVLGGLELAKRHIHRRGPDAQRHIENAMEGANRAAALTRRLLTFARAEPVHPESIDPATLVRGMSDLLDRTLGETVAMRTEDEGRGWNIWIDRHQLENAVLNLAVNARDAMSGRGTLSIATGGTTLRHGEVGECAAGDYVTIAVTDTGSGMPPEVLERVFEPFFTTKPVGKGTGLGLSQIFGFVRQSDGDIAIRTAPGEGTTVTLYLPRYSAGEVHAPAPLTAAAPEPESATEGLDILVVEDDPRVLAATVAALTELGHRPLACNDPREAEAAIARMPALDLILSDVLMPGQTGPEMLARLKDHIGDVPALFVTGYAGEAASADLFGGHPVLRKPFTMAALDRAVADAVAAHAPERTPQAAAARI